MLLLARIGLGALMVAHAKLEYDFAGGSIAGVGALFEKSGVPLAVITGPVNVLFEFVGGAAMIFGLAVLPVGALMALNTVGAWIFVNTGGLYALDKHRPRTGHRTRTAEPGARRVGLRPAGGRSHHRPTRRTSGQHCMRETADSHPDLYWAIHGGGGNFGIVTSFTFRLHPVGPIVAFAGVLYPMEGEIAEQMHVGQVPRNAPSGVTFRTVEVREILTSL